MQSVIQQLSAVRLGAPAQPLSSRAAVGIAAPKRQAPAAVQFAVQAMVSTMGRRPSLYRSLALHRVRRPMQPASRCHASRQTCQAASFQSQSVKTERGVELAGAGEQPPAQEAVRSH